MAENELPAVEVRDLVKVYPRPGGGSIRALDGVTFRVEAGEFFGFLGPNGAGKTTALEIIEGIRKPTSGEVRVLGIDPRRELDKVKRLIGVQLQAASYFSLLTIEEILELFGSFYPKRRSSAEVLETVGLSDRRKAYVRHLSGGQQRRFSVRPPSSTTRRWCSWTSPPPASTPRCVTAYGSCYGGSTTTRERRSS